MARPFILDTCAFIWLLNGDQRMKKIKNSLEKAAKVSDIYICPISIWEIAVKASKGKIKFTMPISDWIQEAKRRTGIQNTALTDDIMYFSTVLPGSFHKDPADRFIVATAIIDKLTLVTGDEKILSWANHQKIKVLAV